MPRTSTAPSSKPLPPRVASTIVGRRRYASLCSLLLASLWSGALHGTGPGVVSLAFDIVDIECDTAPAVCDAAERYIPPGNSESVLAVVLEHAAAGNFLVSHTLVVAPDSLVEQVTVVGESRFEFSVALSEPTPGAYQVGFRYRLEREEEASAGSSTLFLREGEPPAVVGATVTSSAGAAAAGKTGRRITLTLLELKAGGGTKRAD